MVNVGLSTILNPINSLFGSDSKKSTDAANWFGRNLNTSAAYLATAEGLHNLTKVAISATQILNPALYLAGVVPTLSQFHLGFKSVDIVGDLNGLYGPNSSQPQTNSQRLTTFSNILFAFSDAGASLYFANFLGAISTAGLASKLGSQVIFGLKPLQFLNAVNLGTFVTSTSALGFTITAAQLAQTIANGDHSVNTLIAGLSAFAELAVRVFVLAIGTSTAGTVIVAGILGGVAASTATYLSYHATSLQTNSPSKAA